MKANDLAAPRGDSAKFENIGDTIEGTVVYVGDWSERINKFNNKLEQVTRIGIDTGEGEPIYIWPVKGSGMAQAIAEGLREARLDELSEGQKIKLRYDEAVDVGKGNPFKKFRAKVTPGEARASTNSDPF
jgi:hypothetical protein